MTRILSYTFLASAYGLGLFGVYALSVNPLTHSIVTHIFGWHC